MGWLSVVTVLTPFLRLIIWHTPRAFQVAHPAEIPVFIAVIWPLAWIDYRQASVDCSWEPHRAMLLTVAFPREGLVLNSNTSGQLAVCDLLCILL